MRARKLISAAAVLSAVCLLCGCQMGQMCEIGPQSHFIFPNSDVKELGPVKVTMQGEMSMMPTIKTGDIDAELYNRAIRQVSGANVLVNYVRTTTIYGVPGLPLFWSTLQLEGTAAKMEVGRQDIK